MEDFDPILHLFPELFYVFLVHAPSELKFAHPQHHRGQFGYGPSILHKRYTYENCVVDTTK